MRAPRGALKTEWDPKRPRKVWAFEPDTGELIPGYATRIYATHPNDRVVPCWLFYPLDGATKLIVYELWELPE